MVDYWLLWQIELLVLIDVVNVVGEVAIDTDIGEALALAYF